VISRNGFLFKKNPNNKRNIFKRKQKQYKINFVPDGPAIPFHIKEIFLRDDLIFCKPIGC
jgi:hypothetical protein